MLQHGGTLRLLWEVKPASHKKTDAVHFHLEAVFRAAKLRDWMWDGSCQGLEGEGNGERVFNGYTVSALQDAESYGMDSAEGCTAM